MAMVVAAKPKPKRRPANGPKKQAGQKKKSDIKSKEPATACLEDGEVENESDVDMEGALGQLMEEDEVNGW